MFSDKNKTACLRALAVLALMAGCVETPKPFHASVGAEPGKTAIESIAAMKPENLAVIYGPLADPRHPRNANGEVELFSGAGDKDSLSTIKKAYTNVCLSIGMKLTHLEELERKNGARQFAIRCK